MLHLMRDIQHWLSNLSLAPCAKVNHTKALCFFCQATKFLCCSLPILPQASRLGSDPFYPCYVSLSNVFFLRRLCEMGYEPERHNFKAAMKSRTGRDNKYKRELACLWNQLTVDVWKRRCLLVDEIDIPMCLLDIIKAYLMVKSNIRCQAQFVLLQLENCVENDQESMEIILSYLELPYYDANDNFYEYIFAA